MIKRSFGSDLFSVFNYTFFVLLAIAMLYPFWYIFMYSLSDPKADVILNNFYLIPNGFSAITYWHILSQPFILQAFKNTFIVTIVGTLINLVMTVLTAYPLSRRLRGRGWIFGMILFTMIFSGGLIPTYLVVKALGMNNTLWALMVPTAISVYFLMIMYKFFEELPPSLIESAKIDGYNDISILIRIVLPLSPAALASIGLFYAVGHWNDYFNARVYITSAEKQVMQVLLRSMLYEESLVGRLGRSSMQVTPQSFKMTAVMVTLIPIMVVYPFLQRYFIHGVMIGSVKG